MMNTLTENRPQEVSREREHFASPEVNIYETKDGYLLEAEMPGVNKDGLEITLEGNELTITGRRADQQLEGADLLFAETRSLNYRRVFELDPAVDTSKISARMEQGILTLILPKMEKVKPRKIAIQD
jgi:HSP20 family protein